ncbi:MAG TPA: gluconate 2-dehydrogenase subunit 3 family protein [Ramlibacter sp.]|uniref:gluconate 2-dehydrogenase subunit 3 family protein n=1 Tax=Ramlibacter sp. TaxID=1917967 RepID=UPI002CCDBE5C|nr:gluconate 2-dehydrogenase subunit 3 family protein [Ramlibacter sp.]HVZ43169.1 gluconate 2-dehydrogenase subunit 3 family protein [Ramlibacter sp.]
MKQLCVPESSGTEAPRLSRRRLLAAGAVIPIAAAAAASTTTIQREMPWREGAADAPDAALALPAQSGGYTFFSPAESAFVEAAVARLIPADDLGAGAIEAGVPVFIDRQLAGEYGRAAKWYMQGPWAQGEKTQGWQTRLAPAQLYRAAAKDIDEAVAREARAATFAKLALPEQDRWLHLLEDGKVTLPTADAKTFFELLLQNTIEGFFSDPLYGGNRDMAGWKMIGFPGARYDHTPFVARHGESYPLPPVGIMGRPEWSRSDGHG